MVCFLFGSKSPESIFHLEAIRFVSFLFGSTGMGRVLYMAAKDERVGSVFYLVARGRVTCLIVSKSARQFFSCMAATHGEVKFQRKAGDKFSNWLKVDAVSFCTRQKEGWD